MFSKNQSRRNFLKVAGVAAAGVAAANVPGLLSKEPVAEAAPLAASLQTNLSNFVDLRFGMFNHFNMGTFTNEEWATPNQNPKLFAPTAVNCAQWAAAAVSAKMTFGLLTTKHHDGFCLWPSAYNKYNVAYSSYPHDIVKLYTDAYRAAGLKVGLYFSIWDRTYPVQATPKYSLGVPAFTGTITQPDITYVLNQIRELLTNYGQIDIFVNDGYAWEMGQQAMPYQQVRELVKSLQPNTIMIDHGAISQPFLGDVIYFEEPLGITSPSGNTYASAQGQTISNGWFWHPATPTTDPMSLSSILSHLSGLEPKYTTFILNCPPNQNGVLDTNIVNRLAEVGPAWSPNNSRAALPTQQFRTEHPVTPIGATATVYHTGEPPTNAIDGISDKNEETCWSTWSYPLPQSITLDLGQIYTNISTLEYLPKQWSRNNSTDGDITSYTIFTSTNGSTFTQVASGTWPSGPATKLVEWTNTNARYVKIQANAGTGTYANVSEFRIGGRSAIPTVTSGGGTTTVDDEVYGTGQNQFNYVGSGWLHGTSSGCYNNTNSWDKTANDYVTVAFTGTQIKFYGVKDPRHGIGAISIDGGGETNVDFYATTRAGDQLMWTSPTLAKGSHTFKLRVTGTKNASSSDYFAVLDRVDILP